MATAAPRTGSRRTVSVIAKGFVFERRGLCVFAVFPPDRCVAAADFFAAAATGRFFGGMRDLPLRAGAQTGEQWQHYKGLMRHQGTRGSKVALQLSLAGKDMTNDKQCRALLAIGKRLRSELDQAPQKPAPDIDRALRRLLERDIAERSRPERPWAGQQSDRKSITRGD